MKRREFLQLGAAATAVASTQPVMAASLTRKLEFRKRTGVKKPNILLVVLDDVGFGDLGCYGAEHVTPSMDAVANNGVRFNNFHVTALCAPTRACLLTGRNAHAVGVGNIAEWGRDLPGYRGWITKDAATLAEYLREDAYTTLATGKWHLSAIHDQNGSGPYDHWPVGRGFDRWYGFHGNAMDHWHPEMFENTVAAYPTKNDDYHLSTDLVDRSIDYIQDHIVATPDNPFLLYLAFGACHFPLHAPSDDIRRHKGRYDAGWDAIRRQRFRKQLQMGVVPEGTTLAPLNPNTPPWVDLTDSQRQIATHGQEVYAAFLEHTDRQVGRLVDFLRAEGQLDDTILMIMSDNGAAAGGAGLQQGILDVRRASYYEKESEAELTEHFQKLGTDDSYGMAGSGWAQASNTPLKWYKADTYGGGTRAPLIVSWPNGKIGQGTINTQYHHAIDVLPSLMEMIGKPTPSKLNGNSILP
ncbi:MAG: arylsulfatase, partial [Pseudomonadota bacterium]